MDQFLIEYVKGDLRKLLRECPTATSDVKDIERWGKECAKLLVSAWSPMALYSSKRELEPRKGSCRIPDGQRGDIFCGSGGTGTRE